MGAEDFFLPTQKNVKRQECGKPVNLESHEKISIVFLFAVILWKKLNVSLSLWILSSDPAKGACRSYEKTTGGLFLV